MDVKKNLSYKELEAELNRLKASFENLKNENIRYRSIFENSRDAIVISKDRIFEFCNDAYLKLFGYDTTEELIGKPMIEQFSPKEHNKIKSFINNRITGEKTPDFYEATGIKKNGEEFLFTISISKYKVNGETYHVGQIRDHTQRKIEEQKIIESSLQQALLLKSLQESENHLRVAQRIAQIGHWTLNHETNKLTWSDEIYRIFELNPNKFSPSYDEFLAGIHPEDRNKVNEEYLNSIKEKRDYSITHRLLLKNGEIKYVFERCNNVFDKKGNPLTSLGTVQDITDKVKSEKLLKDSEKLQNLLFKINPVPAGILNFNTGKYIRVNDFFTAKLGFTNKDVFGKSPHELGIFSEERQKNLYKLLHKSNHISNAETEIISKSGAKIHALGYAEIIESNNQKLIYTSFVDITEQTKVRDLLIESNEKFSAVFHNTSIPQALTKRNEGIFVEVNEAFTELFGFNSDEIIGKEAVDVGIWISVPERNELMARVSENGFVKNFEYKFGKKGGEIIHGLVSTKEITVGGKDYLITNIIDVSEIASAKEKLSESRKLFSAAFHNISIAQAITRFKDGKFYDINDAFAELMGYSSSDVENLSTLDVNLWTSESDRKDFTERLNQQGLTKKTEYDLRKKDGDIIHCLVYASVINIEGTKYILSVIIDITDRKTMENKLIESEQRWHFSVDGSRLGLWDWNAITNDVYFSPVWKKMLGFKEDEIQGSLEEWERRVHPDDLEQVYSDLNDHFEGKTDLYINEHRVLCKNGEYKWILDRGRVVSWTNDKKPERVIGTHTDIDYEKRTRQEIFESTAKFKLLFDQSPVGIYIADLKGNIVNGNNKLLELMDSPSLEATKKINVLNFPSLVKSGYSENFAKCLETGKSQKVEMDYTSHWGKQSYFSSHILPLFDNNGNIQHIYTLMEDISERKRIENELLESNQRLELFFKQSAIGFFFMMLDEPIKWNDNIDKEKVLNYVFYHQHLTQVNEAMVKQYGTKEEDLLGLTPADFFFGKEEQGKEIWMELLNKGKVHLESKEQKPDGTPFYINGDLISLHDKDGNIIGHFGAQSDVTVERETQEKLAQSEILKKNILASQPILIWAKDINGVYIACNPQFERFFGAKEDEIIGKTDYYFVDKETADSFRDHDKAAVNAGKPMRNEEWITYADNGDRVLLETVKTPLRNENGSIFGVLGISYDITDRKKREETLRKAMHEAEKANKLKSEFLANMSHEIRTPMNAVLGYAEILARNLKDNPENLAYVEGINKGGKNLISLINDILDLSKIEADKLEIKPEAVNLNELLGEKKQIFTAILSEKNVDFKVNIDEKLPKILMLDKTRIKQLLFNLIGNAIKFTEKGYIEVKVKQHGNFIPDKIVDIALEVKDTGIGIPKKKLETIFEAFSQTHNHTLKYEGTGLGLTISRKLVEAMGGTISVESKVGKGSVFTIYLNNIEIHSEIKGSPDKKVEEGSTDVYFNSPDILLVDDIESNLFVLTKQLERFNCNITTSVNGKDAIEKVEKKKPDLIIMDIQMPVLNGFEASKILKKDNRFKDIPIIALTAFALKDQKEEYEGVFDTYLVKPIENKTLLQCLMNYLPYTNNQEGQPDYQNTKATTTGLPSNLPQPVLEELTKTTYPLFEELNLYFDTDDCFAFIKDLTDLAKKFNIPEFDDYCSKLSVATKTLKLDHIEKLLAEFNIFKNDNKI